LRGELNIRTLLDIGELDGGELDGYDFEGPTRFDKVFTGIAMASPGGTSPFSAVGGVAA
jgi:hypothetical protein